MNLRKMLTANIAAKLMALLVGVFIWFNASGQQEVVRLQTVPLVVENLPDTLTITGTLPAVVEIRVTCTKRQLLALGFARVSAAIDLAGSRPGRQRVSLAAGNVHLPASVDRRNVSVIAPSVVDLQLERLVTRRVQAAISTTGSVPDNLILVDGGIAVAPSWITIRGAVSTVERIQSIPTRTLDLSKIKDSSSRDLALEFDPRLLSCDPDHVTATVTVTAKGQRVLANIPPTVLVDSDDLDAVVLPNTMSLTLEGPAAMLDTLSSGDVSVLLNLSGRPPAQYTIAPEVIVPGGITVLSTSVDSLIVRVSEVANKKRR